jgi:DNA invertase Pin-like site-specific DNA recombinase
MCKGISYVRWSHPTQTGGDSRRRQEADFRQFCQAHKLTPCELSYVDAGVSGWSGANVDQGALGAVLEAIKGGTIAKGDCLVVEQLDRLSRTDLDQSLALFGKILRAGVNIGHVRKNRILTKKDLKGFAITEMAMELILAGEESNKKSERNKAKVINNQEQARKKNRIWSSKGPSWLELSEDRSHWIPKPEEVKKVEYIYELSINGMGAGAIAKRLIKEGIKPIGKRQWNRTYVLSILRNRAVLGEYQPCEMIGKNKRKPVGQPIKDYYLQIIDEDTFYKAQAQIDSRRKHRGPISKFINLFSGLIFDKATDSVMWLATKPQRDGSKDKSLYPSAAIQGGGKYWSVRMSQLEPALLVSIWEATIDTKPSPNKKSLLGLKAKRETIVAKIAQTTKSISDHPDFAAALDIVRQLEGDRKETDEQIEKLEAKIAENPEDTLEATKSSLIALANAKKGVPELRAAIQAKLRTLIERIDLDKDDDAVKVQIKFKEGTIRKLRLDGKCFWIGKTCFYLDENLATYYK